MLDSHIIAKAEISWYQRRVGNSNTLFTFFIIRLYPISGSLYITQEIFCGWLSFLLKAIVLVVSHPAYGVGYDYPPPLPKMIFASVFAHCERNILTAVMYL